MNITMLRVGSYVRKTRADRVSKFRSRKRRNATVSMCSGGRDYQCVSYSKNSKMSHLWLTLIMRWNK